MRYLILIVCVLFLFGCEYRIRYVIDGDTIVLDNGKKVRLAGIDCPEMDTMEGVMARDYMMRYQGATVKLRPTIQRYDKYGRLIAWIYVNDKLINQELLDKGYCRRWQ